GQSAVVRLGEGDGGPGWSQSGLLPDDVHGPVRAGGDLGDDVPGPDWRPVLRVADEPGQRLGDGEVRGPGRAAIPGDHHGDLLALLVRAGAVEKHERVDQG